jgi:hypothetical protein
MKISEEKLPILTVISLVTIFIMLMMIIEATQKIKVLKKDLAESRKTIEQLEKRLVKDIQNDALIFEKDSVAPRPSFLIKPAGRLNITGIPSTIKLNGIEYEGDSIVINYGKPYGQALQLVFDEKVGSVILRLDCTLTNLNLSTQMSGDETLAFLRHEVEHLVSSDGRPYLGDSQLTFKFRGKFPIWGPHISNIAGREYHCLYFAQRAIMHDGIIEAWGDDVKTPYYPYNLISSK